MNSSKSQPAAIAPAQRLQQDAQVMQVITVQNGATVHQIVGRQNVYQYSPPRQVDSDTLAAAQALLKSMPTGDAEFPPEQDTLPYGSRIKGLRPNALFVGRDAELQRIARALTQQSGRRPLVISTGIGGIGKTQVAVEFAHRYGHYFAGGVFWVTMERAENISTEVAACGAGGLVDWRPDYAGLKLAEQLALVLAAWQSPLPRLLIFDNCEDEAILAQWCPPSGGGWVLVTSRRTTWDLSLGAVLLPLDVLQRMASIALLRKFRPKLSDADADAIAAELGDLPLALHVAGSYLKAYASAISAVFLAELRSPQLLNHPALQGRGASLKPTGRELHVARVFALSYDRLDASDSTDALAIALLARAAYFAPGVPILRSMLTARVSSEADAMALLIEDAARRLLDLGLLEEQLPAEKKVADSQKDSARFPADDAEEIFETVRLHRLLSAFAQTVSIDAGAQSAAEDVIINAAGQIDAASYWKSADLMLPHLRHMADAAELRADRRAAALCHSLGLYLSQIGSYTAARPYYERALAIREQVLGPQHPDTATSLNDLGMLLRDLDDLVGAQPYLERALAIREQVLEPKHPDIAQSLDSLGELLHSQDDLLAAQSCFERALAMREQVLEPQHPDIALSLNNLGAVLDSQGDRRGARSYFERALAIREQALGLQHPDTAASLNNLGYLLHMQGDLEMARYYYERALVILEQVLGPRHPDTAATMYSLGALLQHLGDFVRSRLYLERALEVNEQALGPEHPRTAASLYALGMLLASLGDLVAARSSYERALAILVARFGADHPNTRTVRTNLAALDA